jgi:glycosyltransferase involved in cell wall biosynthesis
LSFERTRIQEPSSPNVDLSIVVPLYNEEESIQALYSSIVDAMTDQGHTFEIVFVDDGSRDRTVEIASGIAASDSRLRVAVFRKNYGQTAAMAAGIELACGDIIVTMDGDLQNDPLDIPNFVTKMNEGYDIVVGWRFNRKDKLISRKIPSKIANWLIGKVTGVPIKDNGCSLKAYRSSMIKRVPLYNEMHRFIPAMTSITGARIAEIKVRHHARKFGESKYGLSRIYRVLLDMLTVKTIIGFAQRPLVWYGFLSIPFFLLGSIAIVASFLPFIATDNLMSMPLAGTGVLLGALGILLILSGAVGELVHLTGSSSLPKNSVPVIVQRLDMSGTGEAGRFEDRENL